MPALNEEQGLRGAVTDTLAALDQAGVVGELLIVNDGSSDGTGPLAEQLAQGDSRVTVLHHERPMGLGRSFWDGVARAQYDAVVMYPGDNEMLPGEMLLYLDELRNVDMVIPFIANTATARSRVRNFISGVYMFFVRTMLGLKVRHSNGTVLYRRSILKDIDLRNNGYLYQTELLAKTIGRGYLYAEVPYYIQPRHAGKSKAVSIGNIFRTLIQLALLARTARSARAAGPIDPASATASRRARANQHQGKTSSP
ncbi:hypothetical protein LCGC14_0018430 [marine sediment metagenome]|uniref:Glycosyltransferase 2-like domain-containing protein n=1 Tax=marine sediment metagenome TaxID=412755 RepID=A0A0F9YGL0_9ZZZZ|nr:glycosyltransferase family 2 protein [Phycisphaerae bacterium]HDZ44944.1 glycosyltransferase family 2 protein [Phycisphaerae bacterium]